MVTIDRHPFVENKEKPGSIFCGACKRPKPHPVHRISREGPETIKGTAEPTKLG